jgi:cytochrome P450
MTIALFYLLRDRVVYDKLRAELDEHFSSPEDVEDGITLQELPYLYGTVQESLRLGTPFPGLPRVVQKGGCAIDGTFVPEDTIVVRPSYLWINSITDAAI